MRQAPLANSTCKRPHDVLLTQDLIGSLRSVLPIEGSVFLHRALHYREAQRDGGPPSLTIVGPLGGGWPDRVYCRGPISAGPARTAGCPPTVVG
jgi:hypothetical protein